MDQLGNYEVHEQVAEDPPWRLYRARRKCTGHPYRQSLLVSDSGEELILRRLNYIPADAEERKALTDGSVAVTYRHQNLGRVLDWDAQQRFCVEPLITGWRLHLVLDALPMIPLPVACHIVRQVLRGLSYLHSILGPQGEPLGVIHGDVRPQTVLITSEGGVQLSNPALTLARSDPMLVVFGRPTVYERLSPEHAKGSSRLVGSDIFQAGLLLDEMLTGTPVFRRGPAFETLKAIRFEEVLPPSFRRSRVPASFDVVVLKALAKKPEERYESVDHLDESIAKIEVEECWAGEGEAYLKRHLESVKSRLKPRIGGFL